MKHGEADLVRVPEQLRRERFVPFRLVGLGLRRCPLAGDLVDVDRDVRLEDAALRVPRHERRRLELLGLDDRDLEPSVEHVGCLSFADQHFFLLH